MDVVAQRVRREARTRQTPAAGPHHATATSSTAQDAPLHHARPLRSKASLDTLSSSYGSSSSPSVLRRQRSPSIPALPELTYSSSEFSSSESDLSIYGDGTGAESAHALPSRMVPVRGDSMGSEVSTSLSTSDHGSGSHSRVEKGSSSSRGHDATTTPSHGSRTPSHRDRDRTPPHQPPLRRAKSSAQLSSSAKSLTSTSTPAPAPTTIGTCTPSRSREKKKQKKYYLPAGQRAGSSVPCSFSGEYDSDGEPLFVDDSFPRDRTGERGRVGSAPAILESSTSSVEGKEKGTNGGLQTPGPGPLTAAGPILFDGNGEVEGVVQTRRTPRSKRTLTIFETFSFPLPPTPGTGGAGAVLSPSPAAPRTPGSANGGSHRATASESVILSSMKGSGLVPPPVPIHIPTTVRAAVAGLQPAPVRSNSTKRPTALRPTNCPPLHHPRQPPAPVQGLTLPVPKSAQRTRWSPKSASAGGAYELESFLSLHSPLPPLSAALELDERSGNSAVVTAGGLSKSLGAKVSAGSKYEGGMVDEFGVNLNVERMLSQSARGKDVGIELLIGMVDAAIVA